MHGQEIAHELAKRRGKPSPELFILLLKGLRDGLPERGEEGKTITQSYTERKRPLK
jgi:hypothetical protein